MSFVGENKKNKQAVLVLFNSNFLYLRFIIELQEKWMKFYFKIKIIGFLSLEKISIDFFCFVFIKLCGVKTEENLKLIKNFSVN